MFYTSEVKIVLNLPKHISTHFYIFLYFDRKVERQVAHHFTYINGRRTDVEKIWKYIKSFNNNKVAIILKMVNKGQFEISGFYHGTLQGKSRAKILPNVDIFITRSQATTQTNHIAN